MQVVQKHTPDDVSSLETQASRILDIEPSTFQHLLDSLKEILGDFRIRSISLLAPSLHRRQELELIASTFDDFPPRVWMRDEEYTATAFFAVYKNKEATLYVSIHAEQPISGVGLIAKAIRTKFSETVAAKKQLIRKTVIEQSIKSKDVNSFLVRLVRSLSNTFVYAQEVSIFLHEEKFKTISLAATSCVLQGTEKKDIYYQLFELTPTVDAFRSNSPIVKDSRTDHVSEEFDKNLLSFEVETRGFWPISLAWSDFLTLRGKEIAPIGVIRLSNPTRRRLNKSWPARLSDYDQIIVAFMAEVIFVLVQQYQQFKSAETDFARLTHGLGANIEASVKFTSNVKDMLFHERVDARYDSNVPRYTPTFSMAGQTSKHNTGDIYLGLKDLEFFLDDLHYQFTRIHDAGRYEKEQIEKLHSDVLMPAINLAPAIAAVNSKEPPKISNVRARGSFDIKPVSGNRKGLILVLRNLIENSIKYAKTKTADIDLKFSEDERCVIIDYFDAGIGIQSHEVEQIFVEGYRSLEARRTSNRGIGIGLSSSREVMRALDGDLTCLQHDGGAHFRLLIRKIG
jgi:hypothetical protein